ncbi:MAG: hypothetical protein ACW98J_09230 [Candidatus Thorarchaeota archaeon]
MLEAAGSYSISRSTRTVDRFMIAICVLFVFALCSSSYSAAAQNPNLLEQMERDFNELSGEAISWSIYSESNEDNIALIDNIELGSDWADWVLEPQDGFINVIDYYLPQGDIPLCVTQSWLDQFYVTVHVYGGYDLLGWCMELEQKGTTYYIDVVPTVIEQRCCSEEIIVFRFVLPPEYEGQICFEANNWPTVADPFDICYDTTYEDLEKEIYVSFYSLWTGCEEDWQKFVISLVHSDVVNKSYVSPLLATHILFFL